MITTDMKRVSDGSTRARLASWRRRGSGLLLLASLAVFGFGCSADHDGAPPDASATVGEVGVNLRLADGAGIEAVAYRISGGPTHLTGVIEVGKSATISATLGPLAAGSGYSLILAATTSAGAQCSGSAGPFAVTANESTPVSIVLTCPSLHDTGAVAVTGNVSVCPRIAALTAAPSEVYVGSDIVLRAVAGPDDGAHGYPLTYAWGGGVSSSDSAGNAVFHCATPGTFTVDLAVENGNTECHPPSDPAMTASITVTCTEEGSGSI